MLEKYCHQVVRAVPLVKTASTERRVVPIDNDNYRYLRFRAIGNLEKPGFNGNWDGFPYEEFENDTPGFGYKSFVNKRAHLEHNSALQEAGKIGDLPDAFLNKFIYPEDMKTKKWSTLAGTQNIEKRASILSMPGQTDGSIEVLMRIDVNLVNNPGTDPEVRKGLKRIIQAIDTGQQLSCSMGTNCTSSTCSVCGNEAFFAADYCDHLTRRKGALHIVTANEIRDLLDKDVLRPEWLPHIIASSFDVAEVLKGLSNKGIAVRAGEINHGLSFFELSVVANPAYTKAIALENLAKQAGMGGLNHLASMRQYLGDENIINLYNLVQTSGVVSLEEI